jgi:hypothetical protein
VCSALTMFPLIGSFGIVVLHEGIKIDLDFLNEFVYLFSESNFVELILNNLVQPFGRSVGLRQAKRLKEVEKENTRLRKLVADLSLDKAILSEWISFWGAGQF